MKRIYVYLLAVTWLTALTYPQGAQAWGCKGHQTVAYLAEKHLTPEARQMVDALLSSNPIDPQLKRYCGNGGLDAMADSATWADDYRSLHSETGPWHFIDIPLGETSTNVAQFCGAGGCVTQAIQEQLVILKNKNASGENRAMALRFLIHFVGDLHQPLHATTNDDRGGNCVPVKYFGRNPHNHGGSYTPNLHHIWDTEIVERQMQGADAEEFASTLETQFAESFAEWQQNGMPLNTWTLEGHAHAVDTAYGALPVKITAEPDVPVKTCADDNNIGQRMLHKHIVVGANYQDVAAQVVEERLAQAGIRLAMILNEAAKN
ncbi:MAG: hypothetical protein PVS2B2_23200 [Candidatus Acidiferrum sp.]